MPTLTTNLSPLQLALLEKLARGDVITRYGSEWFDGPVRNYKPLPAVWCERMLSDGLIAMHEGAYARKHRTKDRESYVITSIGRHVLEAQ